MANGSIEHIVVLMLENRSYDNMLGGLYSTANAPPYNKAPSGQSGLDGVIGQGLTNPNPTQGGEPIPVANQTTPTQVGGTGPIYPATTIPLTDPGEIFADMAQQIMGTSARPTENPYATEYPPASDVAMGGFTLNYALHGGTFAPPQVPPYPSNYKDVMNYFNPSQVPTTSMLANKYAVCDKWYASAPTQTYTNRAFSLSAAPGVATHIGGSHFSLIDDLQYPLFTQVSVPSVFSQLDASNPSGNGLNWKVYFHDYSITTLTVPYVLAAAKNGSKYNVATFDDTDWPASNTPSWLANKPPTFLDDAAKGNLPPFVLIEPRYSNSYTDAVQGLSPNSNHPGLANYPLNPQSNNPPIDVAVGEAFLLQVYNALKTSSNWGSTLFIVIYDEPGGLYDHVVPPPATMPCAVNWPGGIGSPKCIPPVDDDGKPADTFNFNVFGGRVPAIIASPYIPPSSTIAAKTGSTPFDHTSIIKTVWDVFELSGGSEGMASLNQRDLNAPSLVPFLSNTRVND